MANGFEALGNLLGGGDSLRADEQFQAGRYRTAQTEGALASARKAQADATRQEAENQAVRELQARRPDFAAPTNDDLLSLIVGNLGTQYSAANEGRLRGQEFGNRATAADPAASALARTRALQAVSGKPGSDIDAVGSRGYVNLTDESQTVKPLGDEFGGRPEPSSAVKNYQFAQHLPPEQREGFNRYVRADQIVTAGGVPYATGLNAPATGAGASAPAPLVAPAQVASNKAATSGAVEEAKLHSRAAAELPEKLATISKLEGDIDNLLQSPGFDSIYGLSSQLDPRQLFRGTDFSEAEAVRNKINAETFGVSVQTLRGLGQLSNQEGQKVQQAYTEATNPALSEQKARKAFASLKKELQAARERATLRVARGVRVTDEGQEVPDNGGATLPPANAKGWTLMTDDQGNQAYVSPDGQQFEEVQ